MLLPATFGHHFGRQQPLSPIQKEPPQPADIPGAGKETGVPRHPAQPRRVFVVDFRQQPPIPPGAMLGGDDAFPLRRGRAEVGVHSQRFCDQPGHRPVQAPGSAETGHGESQQHQPDVAVKMALPRLGDERISHQSGQCATLPFVHCAFRQRQNGWRAAVGIDAAPGGQAAGVGEQMAESHPASVHSFACPLGIGGERRLG